MKKSVKILLSVILCICLAIAVIPTAVYLIRGDLSSVSLPDGLEESLRETAFENRADVRIMSSNLLVHYESWGGEPVKPRAKMFLELLETYKPDVIGLQELCDGWYCCLKGNLPEGYKMLYPVSTGVFIRMTAMVYNADRLSLIESGNFAFEQGDNPRLRRVVWAVFEIRETGKRFAVTNTHFDLLREGRETELTAVMKSQVQELSACVDRLEEEYRCPVFCVGDFNTMEDTEKTSPMDIPEIYNMLAKEYTDAKFHSQNQVCGDGQAWNDPSYDHIFISSDMAEAETFALLSWLDGLSDHYPIFADISLKQKT
ncbi:MAG: hypothetical protein ACI4GB_06480 [Acutalibacteraceae bacterium]